jgi:hypothetical protein
MRSALLAFFFITLMLAPAVVYGQNPVIVNTPGEEAKAAALTRADKSLIERAALPKVRKKLADDACEESFEPAGVVEGSFSKAGTTQRLIFYQFCQTGNGLGWAGLILIENNRVVGNYVADAGWVVGLKSLPDINADGLNEVALYYSGGMHQGAGGTGVDIVELGPGGPKGIGWFQAESFSDTGPVIGYKVTVKPGANPAFYRERHVQNAAGRWRRTGASTLLKLKAIVSAFETVR